MAEKAAVQTVPATVQFGVKSYGIHSSVVITLDMDGVTNQMLLDKAICEYKRNVRSVFAKFTDRQKQDVNTSRKITFRAARFHERADVSPEVAMSQIEKGVEKGSVTKEQLAEMLKKLTALANVSK